MEKRKIFLSFRPEFFRPILYDIKKYEYRKRFCNEPTTAYLYLSSPVREVIGIMELGKPINISEIINQFDINSDTYKRLEHNLNNREIFAIPIESFQLYKEPISIEEIKELEPNFFVPQCYLNIENFPKVYSMLLNQSKYDKEFYNSHDFIYNDNLGMSCKEMELTSEFIKKDEIYTKEKKYSLIKSGYIDAILNGEKINKLN